MQQLADDMAEYFNTDYAKIIDQEMASEMPPLYEKDSKAVIYDAVDKYFKGNIKLNKDGCQCYPSLFNMKVSIK